ncbi:MAG: glycosyltransferase [Saprospiraceae bacterium]|nr:glycosyltransferase [Saprospiraceae bacterium]
MSERIVFTVTNDLSYDQRMQRICSTLAEHGYQVTLVGRSLSHSRPLDELNFRQIRLRCRFNKGILFYAEFNLRLLVFLLRIPCDAVCSIDLDTLPAGCAAALLRGKKRVFDAHEYFTEVPEVVHRPLVKTCWALVARLCLPFYRHAYTVGPALADIFTKKYGIPFAVVRNVPQPLDNASSHTPESPRYLLYQGALNTGRGIETAMEALIHLPQLELWLAGEGDCSDELRALAARLGVQSRVKFLGFVKPADLKSLTAGAWLGLNLLENKGLSYYFSLANKFFDYVQAEVPVVTMDFPEARAWQQQYPVAVLLSELNAQILADAVASLQDDTLRYEQLRAACRSARLEWNWEREKAALLNCWARVFGR